MTSESQAYIYVQLPSTLNTVPAALLKVEKLRDGTFVGRFRYGDRYLERKDAVEFDPFQLPLGDIVREFTKRKGIPGAERDADRKSTRLNSSHLGISYAVFCLKKKRNNN